MPNASVGGLVSGLDTATLISQLMQLEAKPQTMLKTRMGTAQKAITSLQAVNAKLAAIVTKAAELAKPAGWAPVSATSTSDKVAVAVTAGAKPTSLTFTVTDVAAASATSYTTTAAKDAAGTVAPSTGYTITYTDGRAAETIDTGDGSLRALADALNKTTGVKATLVLADATGATPTYRLRVESTAAGSGSGFSIAETSPVDPANPVPFLGGPAATTTGADSVLTLSDGTTVTSRSTTVTGLMPGVDVTLQPGAKGATSTVTVAQDAQGMTDRVKAFVEAVNGVLDDIAKMTAYDPATKVAGSLQGDATLRDVRNQLLSTVAMGSGGKSLADVGVQTDRYGKLVFDADKFKTAYTADPTGTAARFTDTTVGAKGLAVGLGEVTKRFSDSIDGTLTLSIKGRNTLVDRMQKDIDAWDVRLEKRKSSLERQYGALEVALGKLQSQSTWLAGQIGSLPSMNSK